MLVFFSYFSGKSLYLETTKRTFKYVKSGNFKNLRIGFSMLINLTRVINVENFEEFISKIFQDLILVGAELLKSLSHKHKSGEKDNIQNM